MDSDANGSVKAHGLNDRTDSAYDAKRERFERIVRLYSADLYRYAVALSRSRAQAEDLVQETFLRAWRRLETLREEQKAKSWLLTTLRREYFRQFERIRPDFDDVEIDSLAAPEGPSDDQTLVQNAIFALPAIHRDVLALQIIGGYSGAEIGSLLGLPRATVNTRLFRARQSLKQALRDGDNATSLPDRQQPRR